MNDSRNRPRFGGAVSRDTSIGTAEKLFNRAAANLEEDLSGVIASSVETLFGAELERRFGDEPSWGGASVAATSSDEKSVLLSVRGAPKHLRAIEYGDPADRTPASGALRSTHARARGKASSVVAKEVRRAFHS